MRERLGVALFVLGTTFLWIVPPFAGSLDRASALADAVHILGVATIVAFAVGAWGVVRSAPWWLVATRSAAVLGLLTGVVVAVVDAGVWSDALLGADVAAHVGGSLALLALAFLPAWRRALVGWLGEIESRRRRGYVD